MSDNNILISPTRGMDVAVNTPVDKGLEEPGFSTTRIDMIKDLCMYGSFDFRQINSQVWFVYKTNSFV